ncbi:MAG: BREX-1 system phosphatase PglZ type B [Nitrospira sp.]|nr:BREX-1 system phosphatase PglZ type B [Nitrospira sp.]
MSKTIGGAITEALRGSAKAYAPGDQVASCAVLWLDPDQLWAQIVPDLLAKTMQELFVLGPYAPAERKGPALWLRCIEARTVPEAPSVDTTPIFYLPNVKLDQLKDLESITSDLAPFAEMQFRGALWLHPNGKEWTPLAFLVSVHGGLGLNVSRDQATQDALLRAMPKLMQERVDDLRDKVLDADFFNDLMAPDATGLILRWLNDPDGFRKRTSSPEWKAFCQQCTVDYRLDPDKDGPMRATELLANRSNHWATVWKRFVEAPTNYRGVVEWLRRAEPKTRSMYDTGEVWPSINEELERELGAALNALKDQPQDKAATEILELESRHCIRRQYPWRLLGLSPFAVTLEPLAKVAALCRKTPGGPTAEAFAEVYVKQAWEVDAAALAVMAACEDVNQQGPVLRALRIIYLPWLEATARHLQQLLAGTRKPPVRRHPPPKPLSGHVVLFADGLRFDVASLLTERLAEDGREVTLDWDWTPLPSVTATSKPMCSPLANSLRNGEISDEFSPTLENGQRITQDRFVQALKASGWQILEGIDTGDSTGSAWTEAGTLDKRGHNEGWKLARAVSGEVSDLGIRIRQLIDAGWSEIHVVTDHGWLLVPGGLPKVELKAFLAEQRWGRCAAIKPGVATNLPEFTWHWNETVRVVVPPGAGCFKAGMEYSHGGVSLQEMVVPHLTVRAGLGLRREARIAEARWTGARCRMVIEGSSADHRVDVRVRQGDASTSFLEGQQVRAIGEDGSVVVFLADDSDMGKHATIVLLNAANQVIHSLPTILGVNL